MINDFDSASSKYDAEFTFSNIGKAQRRMVFKYLNPIIHQDKKLSILELNCGTGEDAIQFSKLGHHVIATDISEGMINVAKAKSNNVSFQIQDINTLHENSFETKFNLIFSNFGGFNCLSNSEIETFFKTAFHLLQPNGKIVLVIMPKHCLWEKLYFSLKGDFKNANRRQSTAYVFANVDGVKVNTWYYNPEDILQRSKSSFKKENIKPIGFAIPPSYLEKSFLSNQPFLSILKSVDTIMTGSFWSKYADHFLIELTKP